MKPRAARIANPITGLLEDVLGCKWSWSVLRAVHAGTTRPGQLERAIVGISTKVLNERLRKLVAHGVLGKTQFAQIPARVEYAFTPLGTKFFAVLQQIEALAQEPVADATAARRINPSRRARKTSSAPPGTAA